MTDYKYITLERYFRVVVRQCVLLHDIGFSNECIEALLETMSKEVARIIKER